MSIMTDLWLSGVFFSSSKYEHVFDRGSAPDPAGGAYDAPPYPLVSWGGAYPSPLTPSVSRSRRLGSQAPNTIKIPGYPYAQCGI